MRASYLLANLRRLRRTSPATVLFNGAFRHSIFQHRGDRSSLLHCRRFNSSVRSTGRGSSVDDGENGNEVSSVGLSNRGDESGNEVFSVDLLNEGGEDSLWYAPVRGVISLLDGYHDITGFAW